MDKILEGMIHLYIGRPNFLTGVFMIRVGHYMTDPFSNSYQSRVMERHGVARIYRPKSLVRALLSATYPVVCSPGQIL